MITLLVGTIGSGKSTVSKKIYEQNTRNTIVVNDDSLVTMLHAGNYLDYNYDNRHLYKAIELSILTHCLCNKTNIIIDKTSLTKITRYKYISIAQSFSEQIRCIYFPPESPETHALRRVKDDHRGKTLDRWIQVATSHIKSMEEPSTEEGFCEVIRYKWEDDIS